MVQCVLLKKDTAPERKSPLLDGYKRAGQHSIVIFCYITYNSKRLGYYGQTASVVRNSNITESMLRSSLPLTLPPSWGIVPYLTYLLICIDNTHKQ